VTDSTSSRDLFYRSRPVGPFRRRCTSPIFTAISSQSTLPRLVVDQHWYCTKTIKRPFCSIQTGLFSELYNSITLTPLLPRVKVLVNLARPVLTSICA